MSTSTDAILAFGFNIADENEMPEKLDAAGKEDPEDDDSYFEFAILAAREAGINPPTMEYDESKDVKAAYHAYWSAKTNAEKVHPLDVIAHCSGECPMQLLAVRGTELCARRGYPLAIGELPTIKPEQIEAMREFCKRYDIEWQEPSWYLFSMWN